MNWHTINKYSLPLGFFLLLLVPPVYLWKVDLGLHGSNWTLLGSFVVGVLFLGFSILSQHANRAKLSDLKYMSNMLVRVSAIGLVVFYVLFPGPRLLFSRDSLGYVFATIFLLAKLPYWLAEQTHSGATQGEGL